MTPFLLNKIVSVIFSPTLFIIEPKFISVEEDIKWICLFKVLYYCGLRRGELRGLTWKNIDLEKKSLSVVQNVVNVSGDHGYWQITTPKTRTSTRTIPIPSKVCEDLIEYKKSVKNIVGLMINGLYLEM